MLSSQWSEKIYANGMCTYLTTASYHIQELSEATTKYN